jgi:ABC-2 type transport system permease protein
MLHLLKIEWLKVKNYRTFWILSGLFLISIFGINYITYMIQDSQPKNAMTNAIIGSPPFEFPEVWHTVTYMSSFLLFIPGLLMIISITNEFSFKTHRQNIIDGLSRTQFIGVKLVLVTIVALFSTIAVAITTVSFGLGEKSTFSSTGIEYLLYFFIQALSYTGIALLFGILFRRSGIAIGVFFLYVTVLENFLGAILNKYYDPVGFFLPLESSDNLIPFPFFRNMTKKLLVKPDLQYLLIAAGIYLLIYYFISRRKFEKANL